MAFSFKDQTKQRGKRRAQNSITKTKNGITKTKSGITKTNIQNSITKTKNGITTTQEETEDRPSEKQISDLMNRIQKIELNYKVLTNSVYGKSAEKKEVLKSVVIPSLDDWEIIILRETEEHSSNQRKIGIRSFRQSDIRAWYSIIQKLIELKEIDIK